MAEKLNPDNEPGRLTFITRFGAGRIRDGLPEFVPPAGSVASARRALWVELAILPLIPVSAALMARGIGAF